MSVRQIRVDDLDQSEKDVSSVAFSYNGASYSIDLGPKNRKKLDDFLAEFIASAKREGGARAPRSGGQPAKTDPSQLAAIRAWAGENGYEVSPRGRIAATVVEAYEAAHA